VTNPLQRTMKRVPNGVKAVAVLLIIGSILYILLGILILVYIGLWSFWSRFCKVRINNGFCLNNPWFHLVFTSQGSPERKELGPNFHHSDVN